MAGGPAVGETSPLIFVFNMTSYVYRGGGQARVFCTHGGGCPQTAEPAEPKHSYFKEGIDVSSAIPYSIRLSVELFSLLLTQQKLYHNL